MRWFGGGLRRGARCETSACREAARYCFGGVADCSCVQRIASARHAIPTFEQVALPVPARTQVRQPSVQATQVAVGGVKTLGAEAGRSVDAGGFGLKGRSAAKAGTQAIHRMAVIANLDRGAVLITMEPLRKKGRNGAPETIRTSDLCLRRATLYPAELRARAVFIAHSDSGGNAT